MRISKVGTICPFRGERDEAIAAAVLLAPGGGAVAVDAGPAAQSASGRIHGALQRQGPLRLARAQSRTSTRQVERQLTKPGAQRAAGDLERRARLHWTVDVAKGEIVSDGNNPHLPTEQTTAISSCGWIG